MFYSQLFDLSSSLTIPIWLLLIGLGWFRPVERVLSSPWIAIVPSTIYAVALIPNWTTVLDAIGAGSLSAITELLGTPAGATLSWAHFLAFDLLIGRWIYLDSRSRNIPHLAIIPSLYLTLMVGPVGFLVYLLTRSVFIVFRKDPLINIVFDSALKLE